MARRPPSLARRRDTYAAATRRPVYSLVFVGMLLLAFHVGTYLYGTSLLAPWTLQKFLDLFGAGAAIFAPLFVLLVLFLQQILHGERWKVRPMVVAGMVGESIAFTLPLVALDYLTRSAVTAQVAEGAASAGPATEFIFKALGAGIYEEFLFRLVLVGLLLLLLVDVFELHEEACSVAAICVSGLAFSAVHFTFARVGGSLEFDIGSFVFLTLAGVYWGFLYLYRGFAIAVGSHVVWDIFVPLANL